MNLVNVKYVRTILCNIWLFQKMSVHELFCNKAGLESERWSCSELRNGNVNSIYLMGVEGLNELIHNNPFNAWHKISLVNYSCHHYPYCCQFFIITMIGSKTIQKHYNINLPKMRFTQTGAP